MAKTGRPTGRPKGSISNRRKDAKPLPPPDYGIPLYVDFPRDPPLDLHLIESVCSIISEGNYPGVAASALGILSGTWSKWMARGQQEAEESKETLFVTLWKRVQKATADAEICLVGETKSLYRERQTASWMGPMTILERSRRDRWGRSEKVEISGTLSVAAVESPPQPAANLAEYLDRARLQAQASRELQAQAVDAEFTTRSLSDKAVETVQPEPEAAPGAEGEAPPVAPEGAG